MKKCKGCGIQLQSKEKNLPGYVVDLNQDYCQRCFRLSHYGDTTQFRSNHVSNEKIIDIYSRYRDSLFVIIIDVLDALVLKDDDLLDIFKDYRSILVINKTDLMKCYKPSYIEINNKKYKNFLIVIIDYNFSDGVEALLNNCLMEDLCLKE